jgi:hypothetical protein
LAEEEEEEEVVVAAAAAAAAASEVTDTGTACKPKKKKKKTSKIKDQRKNQDTKNKIAITKFFLKFPGDIPSVTALPQIKAYFSFIPEVFLPLLAWRQRVGSSPRLLNRSEQPLMGSARRMTTTTTTTTTTTSFDAACLPTQLRPLVTTKRRKRGWFYI